MARSPARPAPKKPHEWLETIPQRRVVVAIVILVSAGTIGLSTLGAFLKLNNQVHDALLEVRGQQPLSDQITIVEIDDATYDAFGWPVPRDVYGAIVHIAGGLGVKAIGFDVLFRDPSPEPEPDAIFSASVQSTKRVVLPSARRAYFQPSSRWPLSD